MKVETDELKITIKKVDENNYKIFYKDILLDKLEVIPMGDFYFNIKLNNLEHAMVYYESSNNFRFITGGHKFYVYIHELFQAD